MPGRTGQGLKLSAVLQARRSESSLTNTGGDVVNSMIIVVASWCGS